MTEQTEQQANSAALGLADLALMANIIQVTSERGAIKANEMEAVGALYKKLVEFVNTHAPQPDTTAQEDSSADKPEEQ